MRKYTIYKFKNLNEYGTSSIFQNKDYDDIASYDVSSSEIR